MSEPLKAPESLWAEIARQFRAGLDTYEIALALSLDEFAVANALTHALALESERAA